MRLIGSVLLLIAAATTASGEIIFDESSLSSRDFSNTFGGANLLPFGTTLVNGMVNPNTIDNDYFKFASLEPGTAYLLIPSFTGIVLYGVLDSNQTFLNGPSLIVDPMAGTVPADGSLVIYAAATSNFGFYTMRLLATQASTTPEPASFVVTGLALAALALRRKCA